MEQQILQEIVAAFSELPFIKGIALGGSRATGTASLDSDIDIGLYYNHEELDYDALNEKARELDDQHRFNLIGKEGDWGQWVNFGGWLKMHGIAVDLIFRDIKRIGYIMDETHAGIYSNNYHAGHPHAYISCMYRGELALSKLLYAADPSFSDLKTLAQHYPEKLQSSLIQYYLFEADFSLMLAKKAKSSEDLYYLSGILFRAISSLNQVVYAKNKIYLINEKKALLQIDRFEFAPVNYRDRVNAIFETMHLESHHPIQLLESLLADVQDLIIKQ